MSACMTRVFPSSAPCSSRVSTARSVRRRIASAVSKIGTPIASIGTPSETKSESLDFMKSGRVERTKPRYIEPVSPRKTLAGWKL